MSVANASYNHVNQVLSGRGKLRVYRPYHISQDTLFIDIRPLVDAGERRFLHDKARAEVAPRRFGICNGEGRE